MGHRPRFNDKARAKKPTIQENNSENQIIKDSENTSIVKLDLLNPDIQLQLSNGNAQMSSKKRKRLEKFIEKQLKKEDRINILEKLSHDTFSSNLFMSSKSLGQKKMTAKQKLRQALNEHRQGVPCTVEDSRLFQEISDAESNISDSSPIDDVEKTKNTLSPSNDISAYPNYVEIAPIQPKVVVIGSALKSSNATKPKISNAPVFTSFYHSESSDTESLPSPDEEPSPLNLKIEIPVKTADIPVKVLSDSKIPIKKPSILNQLDKAFFVPVNRSQELLIARMSLPVVGEEQAIMEAITTNDVTILCGETGSGKTTQVPQFLYEAGFGDPKHPLYPGMIGITEPRRVAAISTANRVAHEMNLKNGEVAYHVRYDKGKLGPNTRIKFMTDGILLKELSDSAQSTSSSAPGSDLLLSKYSCIIIDEAHERTVGTDVLIGWLTRIVRLRNSGKVNGIGPLRVVIMSATLRIQDFTQNKVLFPSTVPPVVSVQGRQHRVVVHYNKKTTDDYIGEAFKKILRIHNRLPHGGILVFMTGQHEIQVLVKKLETLFSNKSETKNLYSTSSEKISSTDEDDTFFEENIDDNYEDEIDNESIGYDSESDDEEENVEILGGTVEETEIETEELLSDTESRGPLHVLPLYSNLPTALQLKVFENPPIGSRLCVIATNVAETSLTIPGIKYVIDCGKVKERKFNSESGLLTYQVGWTSKSSSDQRAGRAGRMGPGHCYRLFSSAVFANYFEEFSEPEILRTPIEGVVLQMKAVGIKQVVHFPFPTVPDRSNLANAEKLLKYLGALEVGHENLPITELGRLMSYFPISPRFAKMIILAAQQSTKMLLYIIVLVSALSVGDPFVRDDEAFFSMGNEDQGEHEIDEEKRKKRTSFYRVMQMLSGSPAQSDPLRYLAAIGAYLKERKTRPESLMSFCESYFLRHKAVDEIFKLKNQLIRISVEKLGAKMPNAHKLNIDDELLPPTSIEKSKIRQILLAGYPDKIARKMEHQPKNLDFQCYETMWDDNVDNFYVIHPSSCLYGQSPAPEWIIYDELIGKQKVMNADNTGIIGTDSKKLWLKNITIISEKWITALGSKILLREGQLLPQPEAKYDMKNDNIIGFCKPSYGPKGWDLCIKQTVVKDSVLKYQLFGRYLLEGQIFKDDNLFKRILPYMKTKPSSMNKKWCNQHAKVVELMNALSSKGVANLSGLKTEWEQNPGFLLKEYLLWVPIEIHDAVKKTWPAVTMNKKNEEYFKGVLKVRNGRDYGEESDSSLSD